MSFIWTLCKCESFETNISVCFLFRHYPVIVSKYNSQIWAKKPKFLLGLRGWKLLYKWCIRWEISVLQVIHEEVGLHQNLQRFKRRIKLLTHFKLSLLFPNHSMNIPISGHLVDTPLSNQSSSGYCISSHEAKYSIALF